MSENTQQATDQVVDITTGELIDLREAPASRLAEVVQALKDQEAQFRHTKAVISREMHRRMDANAEWTIEEDGWKISGKSRETLIDYDPERLKIALEILHGEGKITEEAAKRALRKKVEFVPQKAGVKKLVKLGAEVADVIADAAVPVDPDSRRVSISPPESWYAGADS